MAKIEITDGTLVVTMQGWHRLWALKRRIDVPLAHVRGVEIDPEISGRPRGLRLPGSHVPGLITAGSYRSRDGWDFWDVRRPEQAIVVHLDDERYQRLILEVTDPKGTVAMIRSALGADRGRVGARR